MAVPAVLSFFSGLGTEYSETAADRGCFSGFIDQFREQVKATRADEIADDYLAIADLVERKWKKE